MLFGPDVGLDKDEVASKRSLSSVTKMNGIGVVAVKGPEEVLPGKDVENIGSLCCKSSTTIFNALTLAWRNAAIIDSWRSYSMSKAAAADACL